LRSIPATPEVLDHDRAVLADQAGGQLVQAIAAGVGHGGVQAGDAGLGLAPPVRRLLAGPAIRADTAGGLPLQATQLPLGDLQVFRVGDDLTGREHRQRLHPEVDPDRRLRPGRGRVVAFDLHGERAEPAPALVRDGGRADPGATAFQMP
jgi:hypothetical protein